MHKLPRERLRFCFNKKLKNLKRRWNLLIFGMIKLRRRQFYSATLLELKILTGRTHQIRVHMAYIGHPIVGDEKYGSRAHIGRPALHAKTLGFIHPKTKPYVEFTTELPADMVELIKDSSIVA